MDEEEMDVHHRIRRRDATRELFRNYTIACSIAGLIFTAGYNWRRINELFDWKMSAQSEYVKKDILIEQFKVFNQQMLNLQVQLSDLKETVEKKK